MPFPTVNVPSAPLRLQALCSVLSHLSLDVAFYVIVPAGMKTIPTDK